MADGFRGTGRIQRGLKAGSPKITGPGQTLTGFADGLDIIPPFLNDGLHIIREFGIEKDLFSAGGVDEPEGFGMQRLPGTKLETVFHKLLVFAENSSFQNFIPSIKIIVE